ncbi:Sas10/Utp3/C1D family-domain-containing protein [Spinellus fusiger]|nr:Sas10/Utp3/C1D family-domain-containing protein [Spinellus fusiger]
MSAAVVTHKSNEKTREVSERSPLTKLILDLKAKTNELKMQLQPIMKKLADGEIKTSKGVSFLEVKYHIMVQYLLQLTFYAHLKLSGKQVENHPVIGNLVELRVHLDKMKPIEAKLKYQIDKLVRTAVMGTQKNETGTVSGATAVANDPLAFKPNPMNLLSKNEEEEEEDEDAMDDKTGVYRPPKLAPVNYDIDKDKRSKNERNEERLKEKASRSRVLKDLMQEMNETPEEIDVHGGVNEGTGYGDRVDSLIAEKSKYEENNYVRLAVTRKEKKRMQSKNKMRFESEFDVRKRGSSPCTYHAF